MDRNAHQIASLPTSINDTWLERLMTTLLSYSISLAPIASIVILTKFKLIPERLRENTLIKWFVYGRDPSVSSRHVSTFDGDDSQKLLGPTAQSTTKLVSRYRSSSSTVIEFLWCLLGLQFSYLCWGILQEKIMTTQYSLSGQTISINHNSSLNHSITFHDSQFLVFMNRITAFVLSILALIYNRPRKPRLYHENLEISTRPKPSAPLYEYIYCSLSNTLSSWCQYEALKFVNFPTQVLSKSCKIVPVMLMSKLMMRKKYRTSEYTSALLLSIGMTIFLVYQPPKPKPILSQESLKPKDGSSFTDVKDMIADHFRENASSSGLAILALYLAFDSFTSNWQNRLFDNYGITNWQMMAATNFYSIILTLTSLHQLGNLRPATNLLLSSQQLFWDCIMMSMMSAIGQLFVYHTIRKFGSVIFVSIMTLRLFLAVILSCIIYGHKLSLGSINGLVIVFLVVGYQAVSKLNSLRRREGVKQEVISFKTLSK